MKGTGIAYPIDVDAPTEQFKNRRLTVEVDGNVIRIETAGLAKEKNRPFGAPGVSIEMTFANARLLVEEINNLLTEQA